MSSIGFCNVNGFELSTLLPQQLLQSLSAAPGFKQVAFVKAHEEQAITSIRFQPIKFSILHQYHSINSVQLPISHPVPWCEAAYYLQERPSFTFDPLFHAGLYYVQEASSMFLLEILKQTIGSDTKNKTVLDLCAAPGGKSTLLSSYFKDGLVVANEVIKSRVNVLSENITKWGNENVVVTNNDPSHFQKLDGFFDVLLIDAPCSGSGLFRKDKEAINEWSEEAVTLCSLRQQRIVADAYTCLQQNGVLIYSTCSYSVEEDEKIIDLMMENYQLSSVRIQLNEEWNIIETQSEKHKAYGYRFYPDKLAGEGFFISAFRKNEGNYFPPSFHQSMSLLTKKEGVTWQSWFNYSEPLFLLQQKEFVIAIPELMHNYLGLLQRALYIKQAGIVLGEIKGKYVIPHHALAVSNLANASLPAIDLTREQAILFLQKKEIGIATSSLEKGWHLALYCGIRLGWLKVLPNRINNYYPTDWRILKN